MEAGSMPWRRSATSEVTPQSTSTRCSPTSTSRQVCSRPPLPKASPEPRNVRRTPNGSARDRILPVAAPILTLGDVPDPEAAAVVDRGLDEYNQAHAGYRDSRTLNVVVRDPETGAVLGGLTGHTSLGLLFV